MNSITNLHQGQNKVIVLAGYDNTTTNITLVSGHGAMLPDVSTPYNLIWWNASDYLSPIDDPSVEIVKCIAKFGDTLVIMRSQQQTLASPKNIHGKLYNMAYLPDNNDNNLVTLSYYNVPQLHGKTKHDATTIDGGITLPIGQLPTHGIGAHTGTIGTWANIDKTTSSITDITTRSHTLLSDIGVYDHATIDAHMTSATAHGSTSAATANAIIQRDAAGRAKIVAPSAIDDIARKDTVDAVQTNLTTHGNLTTAHGSVGTVLGITTADARYAPVSAGVLDVLAGIVGTLSGSWGTAPSPISEFTDDNNNYLAVNGSCHSQYSTQVGYITWDLGSVRPIKNFDCGLKFTGSGNGTGASSSLSLAYSTNNVDWLGILTVGSSGGQSSNTVNVSPVMSIYDDVRYIRLQLYTYAPYNTDSWATVYGRRIRAYV